MINKKYLILKSIEFVYINHDFHRFLLINIWLYFVYKIIIKLFVHTSTLRLKVKIY